MELVLEYLVKVCCDDAESVGNNGRNTHLRLVEGSHGVALLLKKGQFYRAGFRTENGFGIAWRCCAPALETLQNIVPHLLKIAPLARDGLQVLYVAEVVVEQALPAWRYTQTTKTKP